MSDQPIVNNIDRFFKGAVRQIPIIGDALQWGDQMRERDYQRALQREVFAREDTAAQRRANDLEAAGLSKTLAAGSAASSGALTNPRAPDSAADKGRATAALNMQMAQTKASVNLANAQARVADSQAALNDQKVTESRALTPERVILTRAQVRQAAGTVVLQESQYDLNRANEVLAELRVTEQQKKNAIAEVNVHRAEMGLEQDKATLIGLEWAGVKAIQEAYMDAYNNAFYRRYGVPTGFNFGELGRTGLMLRASLERNLEAGTPPPTIDFFWQFYRTHVLAKGQR